MSSIPLAILRLDMEPCPPVSLCHLCRTAAAILLAMDIRHRESSEASPQKSFAALGTANSWLWVYTLGSKERWIWPTKDVLWIRKPAVGKPHHHDHRSKLSFSSKPLRSRSCRPSRASIESQKSNCSLHLCPRNEIVMDRPIVPIWPSERSKGAWKLQQPLLKTFTHQSTVPLKNQPRRYHAGRDRLDLVSFFPWHPLAPPTQAISKRDVMLPDLEVKNAIDPNSILPSQSLILPWYKIISMSGLAIWIDLVWNSDTHDD